MRPTRMQIALFVLAGLLAVTATDWAVETTGVLKGKVQDPEGRPLAGAELVLTAAHHAQARTAQALATGEYAFEALPPDTYSLDAKLSGFEPAHLVDIALGAGETKDLDVVLKPLPPPLQLVAATPAPAPRDDKAGERKLERRRPERALAREPGPAAAPMTTVATGTLGYVGSGAQPPAAEMARASDEEGEPNTEAYDRIEDNPFRVVRNEPLSTFSIDVDTASYANVRRFLQQGQRPPKDAVRIEELLNYFTYDYPQPAGDAPFSVNVEVADAPWKLEHRLVRIGLKGKEIPKADRPASNLVFLLDVSGSMNSADKLPLLRSALKMLAVNLGEQDRVAIAVYAGASGLVLPSTSHKREIFDALDRLQAGGSTNGGQGIELAYKVAKENFIEGGNNRVILATDGDFNVGVTSQGGLTRLIEEKAKTGVFLSVLGFGTGNLKDSTMEKLADKGNGNYAYIDTMQEARKVLVQQMGGTLFTIAKDVKIQIEFNPSQVAGYRLIGYENRLLRAEDFNDDKKDAGEIGAGHTVTALYEVVPAGQAVPVAAGVDALKYQQPAAASAAAAGSGEMLTVKLRYKKPDGETSQLIEMPVADAGTKYSAASEDFKFAAAVASFGMLLRGSEYKGTGSYDAVLELADEGKGPDKEGWRGEFLQLVKQAKPMLAK